MLKCGKGLLTLPDAERHRVSIALKNLRYSTEFFAPLFDNRERAQRYIRQVLQLQDVLGAQNDAAGIETFLDRVAAKASADTAFAAGVMVGWHRAEAEIIRARLGKVWKRFRAQKVFWG